MNFTYLAEQFAKFVVIATIITVALFTFALTIFVETGP